MIWLANSIENSLTLSKGKKLIITAKGVRTDLVQRARMPLLTPPPGNPKTYQCLKEHDFRQSQVQPFGCQGQSPSLPVSASLSEIPFFSWGRWGVEGNGHRNSNPKTICMPRRTECNLDMGNISLTLRCDLQSYCKVIWSIMTSYSKYITVIGTTPAAVRIRNLFKTLAVWPKASPIILQQSPLD